MLTVSISDETLRVAIYEDSYLLGKSIYNLQTNNCRKLHVSKANKHIPKRSSQDFI